MVASQRSGVVLWKGPERENLLDSLYFELRRSANLFAAWRHVKRSALTSSNSKIRGHASEFEHQHQKHIRKIQAELKACSFEFDDVEGILKDKEVRKQKGKAPRPITIGSIRNRVVQRALLQVLQPRSVIDPANPNTKYQPKSDPRIGRLNDVNRSRFGVGGLIAPYGGVRPATKLVMDAMSDGAAYYFQSDIKGGFLLKLEQQMSWRRCRQKPMMKT